MKYRANSLQYRAIRSSSRSYIGCALTLSILALLLLASAAMARIRPVILFRPSPGNCYQLYVTNTGDKVALLGTENMEDVIMGDVDGDRRDDDIVYRHAAQGGLRYYLIPRSGIWIPGYDGAIPNTHSDAIPMTIVRAGSVRLIVYKSPSAGQAFAIELDGSNRVALGQMDKAYAVDVTQRGYAGDLVWWKSGSRMCWREGVSGADHAAPYPDWVPLGGGRVYSDVPSRVIAFTATQETNKSIYVCDKDWGFSRIDGTSWPWCVNEGSLIVGEVDGSYPYAEIAFVKSATDPLQWYDVPLSSSGTWYPPNLVTKDDVHCGWNLRGVGRVDLVTAKMQTISRIADLARKSDGTRVQIAAKPRTKLVRELGPGLIPVVTGYYIEEPDRGAGIRVMGQTSAAEGQPVAVTGTLYNMNGERVILAHGNTVSSGTTVIAPLQSTVQTVLSTAAMTGLLVQLNGAISAPTTGWFSLVDGAQNAVRVYCADPISLTGQLAVTGCVGAEKIGNAIVRVLRVGSASDISGSYTPPPDPPNPPEPPDPPDPPDPPAPPPPSPVQPKYTTWIRSSMERVFKDDPSRTLQAPILKAGRNEYESFQIVMRAGSTQINSITLTASELSSVNGTIPASNVSLYLPWYIRLQTLNKDYADPLPPYQGAYNLAAGQTQPIWVEVYVPDDVPAGNYDGMITIKDASGAITYVPYGVRVYDFTLPVGWKSQTSFGMRWDNIADKHGVTQNSAAHNALKKKYYEMGLEHGLSAYSLPVDIMSSEADSYLRDPRMTSFEMPWEYITTQAIRDRINKAKSFGVWDKAYFKVWDEPRYIDQLNTIIQRSTFIHSIDPTAKTKCSITATKDGSNPFTTLRNYLDIWCTVTSYLGSSNLNTLKGMSNKTLWSYYCYGVPRQQWAQIYLDQPTTAFPMVLWQNYNAGITGFLYWDTIYWKYLSDPWTNLQYPLEAAIYGEGILMYPGNKVGIDGPVSSIRLKLLRDGLEDYQKFWMLEQKSGRSAVTSITQQVTTSYTSWTRDINVLQSARDQIAQKLEN